jgi:hypothetical protein
MSDLSLPQKIGNTLYCWDRASEDVIKALLHAAEYKE